MVQQIFINLPVKDLPKSIAFFEQVGFSFNPTFTNESGACMIMGENIFAMLLTEAFFSGFTKKQIADTSKVTEVINCISVVSKEKVEELLAKAAAAGGNVSPDPMDHGWMYQRSFQDIDGHQWEVIYTDPAGPSSN